MDPEFWAIVGAGVAIISVIVAVGIYVANQMGKFDDRLRHVEIDVVRLDERTKQRGVAVPLVDVIAATALNAHTIKLILGMRRMNATHITHCEIGYCARVRYFPDGELIELEEKWAVHGGVEGTSAEIDELNPETTYEVRVRAFSEAGPGP